ncbi:MAG: acyl-CoA dehydrogenase [Alphaproteobacteria bacterium]|nr:MAG: acyl-CoA dehydrogenase [Alphaproteobacteria bacterium]
MAFQAPLRDMMFTLEHVIGMSQLEASGAYEDLSFDLTRSILEEAGKFAAEELAPLNVVGDTQHAVLENGVVTVSPGFKEAYQSFVELGFGSLPCDPAHGGQGLPGTLALALMEFWNSANISWGLCPMLTEGAVKAISAHGTEAQKNVYLPKLISGEWTGTMNLTEPQAGSDVGALRAQAVPQADGSYRLRGTKIFITWGEHNATDNIIHLVLARLPDAPAGTRGISLFIVPKFLINEDGSLGDRNDVRCLKLEEKLGIHGSPTCVLEFGENEGAIGYLLGEENKGMACMFTMMNSARLNVGSQGVAVAEAAYQKALAFAQERVQGKAVGRPEAGDAAAIIEHADIRRMLMHMKSHVDAGRAICFATAVASDLAETAATEEERQAAKAREEVLTPIAKAWGTDIGNEVASLGVQIHGGMGFMEETGAAQFFRDVRITPIYEGTNGIQAIDLATRKLGLQGGEATSALVTEIEKFAASLKASDNHRLASMGESLGDAVEALAEAVTWLRAETAQNMPNVMAGATPYLRLFGNVTGGYFLARAAKAAADLMAEGEGDTAFFKSKLALASYYAGNVLPLSKGLLMSVQSGAEVLYEADPAALAS